MYRASVMSGVFLLAAVFVCGVRAGETDIRRELEHAAEMQMQAFKRKDVKTYMKYIAPSYSVKTVEGHALSKSRPELEREILTDMENTVSIDFVIRVIKQLKVQRNQLIVIINQKSSRVLKEGDSQHKWESSVVQRERWTRTAEGLKLSSIEMLEVKYLLQDGKLMKGSRAKNRSSSDAGAGSEGRRWSGFP